MPGAKASPDINLPKSWPEQVKSATLQMIGLAQVVLANARGWAADCANPKV